ncbi:hypothetical protein [Alkalicoccobacillus plakortidis]|uniref:Uncharacterized protein n=1 Tax=Alkalicoccobacillus plakortidis TaxID=444060 RepID=A0ABT0XJ01_9BACI|nr:hypothetical protein [Alkalicoccobacillus plakortidis]MCM2675890.1 hypothetical protein [Alkalicoccobacillus plakortidis]
MKMRKKKGGVLKKLMTMLKKVENAQKPEFGAQKRCGVRGNGGGVRGNLKNAREWRFGARKI